MGHVETPNGQQTELEMVTIESLVPSDHLLRKIDKVMDFSFILGRVVGLYSEDNGRPPPDPVAMFKALLSAICSASAPTRWFAKYKSM